MRHRISQAIPKFPFLFGGTFIEASYTAWKLNELAGDFPSFSEGLSLRRFTDDTPDVAYSISLPFRRDFH